MTQLAASTVACPRCRQPLIDPHGLGWCKACGYCRSLQESTQKAADTSGAEPAKATTLTATTSAVGQMPSWIWISLLGVAVIAGIEILAGRYLVMSPLARALLATLQIGAAVIMMFVGQFLALLRIAPEDPTLSFPDALFPFRLYGLVLKRMPKTRITFFSVWGLAVIVSTAVFIGGLGHWLTYLPKTPGQAQKAGSK